MNKKIYATIDNAAEFWDLPFRNGVNRQTVKKNFDALLDAWRTTKDRAKAEAVGIETLRSVVVWNSKKFQNLIRGTAYVDDKDFLVVEFAVDGEHAIISLDLRDGTLLEEIRIAAE